MKHLKSFNEEYGKSKSKPKYKVGQRLVFMYTDPEFTIPADDNMVVSGDPSWYEYENHPNGGYWQYPIKGKANECPEDLLLPYVKGQEEYQLPVEFQRKRKKRK